MSTSITKREQSLTEQPKQRTVTAKTPHGEDMVIADLSGSMAASAFEGKSRYACLQEALAPYVGRVQVLAFNDSVKEVDADALPEPAGGTKMHTALQTAEYLEPLMVLLISDGMPSSRSQSLSAAASLAKKCIINVMYIGPENASAESFMQELATVGNGAYCNFRIDKQSPLLLENKIGSLLALPAPGAIEL